MKLWMHPVNHLPPRCTPHHHYHHHCGTCIYVPKNRCQFAYMRRDSTRNKTAFLGTIFFKKLSIKDMHNLEFSENRSTRSRNGLFLPKTSFPFINLCVCRLAEKICSGTTCLPSVCPPFSSKIAPL